MEANNGLLASGKANKSCCISQMLLIYFLGFVMNKIEVQLLFVDSKRFNDFFTFCKCEDLLLILRTSVVNFAHSAERVTFVSLKL